MEGTSHASSKHTASNASLKRPHDDAYLADCFEVLSAGNTTRLTKWIHTLYKNLHNIVVDDIGALIETPTESQTGFIMFLQRLYRLINLKGLYTGYNLFPEPMASLATSLFVRAGVLLPLGVINDQLREIAAEEWYMHPRIVECMLQMMKSGSLIVEAGLQSRQWAVNSIDENVVPLNRLTVFHNAALEFFREHQMYTVLDRYIAAHHLIDVDSTNIPKRLKDAWNQSPILSQISFPEKLKNIQEESSMSNVIASVFYSFDDNFSVRHALEHRCFNIDEFNQLRYAILRINQPWVPKFSELSISDNLEASYGNGGSLYALLRMYTGRDFYEIVQLPEFANHEGIVAAFQSIRYKLFLLSPVQAFLDALSILDNFNITIAELKRECRLSVITVFTRILIEGWNFRLEGVRRACLEFMSLLDCCVKHLPGLRNPNLCGPGVLLADLFLRIASKLEEFCPEDSRVMLKSFLEIMEVTEKQTLHHKRIFATRINVLKRFPRPKDSSKSLGNVMKVLRSAVSDESKIVQRVVTAQILALHVAYNVQLDSELQAEIINYGGLPWVVMAVGDVLSIRPDFLLNWIWEHKDIFSDKDLFLMVHSLGLATGNFHRGNYTVMTDPTLHMIFCDGIDQDFIAISRSSLSSDSFLPPLSYVFGSERLEAFVSFLLMSQQDYASSDNLDKTDLSLDRARLEIVSLIGRGHHQFVIDSLNMFYPNNCLAHFMSMIHDFWLIRERLESSYTIEENSGNIITHAEASILFFEQYIRDLFIEEDDYSHIDDSRDFSRVIAQAVVEELKIRVCSPCAEPATNFQDQEKSLEGSFRTGMVSISQWQPHSFGGEYEEVIFNDFWQEYQLVKSSSLVWGESSQRKKYIKECHEKFSKNRVPFMLRGDFFYRLAVDMKQDYTISRSTDFQLEMCKILFEAHENWRKCDRAIFDTILRRIEGKVFWTLLSIGQKDSFDTFSRIEVWPEQLQSYPQGLLELPLVSPGKHYPWINDNTDPLDEDLVFRVLIVLVSQRDISLIVTLVAQLDDNFPLLDFVRVLIIMSEIETYPPVLNDAMALIWSAVSTSGEYTEERHDKYDTDEIQSRLGIAVEMKSSYNSFAPSLSNPTVRGYCGDLLESIFGSSSEVYYRIEYILEGDSDMVRLNRLLHLIENLSRSAHQKDLQFLQVLNKLCDLFKSSVDIWKTMSSELKQGAAEGTEDSTLHIKIMDILLQGASFRSIGALFPSEQLSGEKSREVSESLVRAFTELLLYISRMPGEAVAALDWWPWKIRQFDEFSRLGIVDATSLANCFLFYHHDIFLSHELEIEYLLAAYFAASLAKHPRKVEEALDRINECLQSLFDSLVLREDYPIYEEYCNRVLSLTGEFEHLHAHVERLFSLGSLAISQLDRSTLYRNQLRSFALKHLDFDFWNSGSPNIQSFRTPMLKEILVSKFRHLGTELEQVIHRNSQGFGFGRFVFLYQMFWAYFGIAANIGDAQSRMPALRLECLRVMNLIHMELEWSSTRLYHQFNFVNPDSDEFDAIWKRYADEDGNMRFDAFKDLVRDATFSGFSRLYIKKSLMVIMEDEKQEDDLYESDLVVRPEIAVRDIKTMSLSELILKHTEILCQDFFADEEKEPLDDMLVEKGKVKQLFNDPDADLPKFPRMLKVKEGIPQIVFMKSGRIDRSAAGILDAVKFMKKLNVKSHRVLLERIYDV